MFLAVVRLGRVSSSFETSLYSFVSTSNFDKRSFIDFSSSRDGFSSKRTYCISLEASTLNFSSFSLIYFLKSDVLYEISESSTEE